MNKSFLKDDIHIEDLKDYRFFVPSYQRGYKWRPQDVKYLIHDLIEYKGDKPYYMQPLVVAEKDGKFIVVDGQQRLTTFFLIWRRLNSLGYFQDHPLGSFHAFLWNMKNGMPVQLIWQSMVTPGLLILPMFETSRKQRHRLMR